MEDGGKLLRPLFVLGACTLWREDGDCSVEKALPAAAAIEMFHNFTLMHDDIMDDAPLRRGRESAYRRWGTNVATLSGDALMILAYRQLSLSPPELIPDLLGFFNKAAIEVCEGQRLDMDYAESTRVGLDDYLRMIELKTAALFVGAVSMGALVGGAPRQDIERLRLFALQFGIAFQIQDDLLDTYGDARLGKTLGGDILAGKQTFLRIGAWAAADELDRAELESAHNDTTRPSEERIARALEIYERHGVRAATEAEIERRFALATSALEGLSAPEDRIDKFRAFAWKQFGRNH